MPLRRGARPGAFPDCGDDALIQEDAPYTAALWLGTVSHCGGIVSLEGALVEESAWLIYTRGVRCSSLEVAPDGQPLGSPQLSCRPPSCAQGEAFAAHPSSRHWTAPHKLAWATHSAWLHLFLPFPGS